MGGGDLNLKKSWHPQTMRNQEKVWKAEQAKSQEERKLNDLRREIAEEKSREELKRLGESSGVLPKNNDDKKLEWMYKKSTDLINREEYLLGRTIDKSFETLQAEEQRKDQNMVGVKQSINHVEHECIPFSIRSYRNLESTEQVDLQRKVMEDPLMLIKQREMESRRKLLENPVKLKELHRILKTDQLLKKAKKSKKSKKAKKSKKKCKKRSKSSSDASSDSEAGLDTGKNLDKELAKRYKKLNREENLVGLNLTKLLDAKFETISKELDKAADGKRRPRKSRRSRSDSNCSRKSNNAEERRRFNRNVGTYRRNAHRSRSPANERNRRRARSRSLAEQRTHRRTGSRSRPDQRRKSYSQSPAAQHRRSRRTRSKSPPEPRHRSDSRSPAARRNRRQRSSSKSPDEDRTHRQRTPNRCGADRKTGSRRQRSRSPAKETNTKQKLSEEEKAARLREMMENATWRETDRTQAVQKHRDAYAREEEQNKKREFDADFINKEVKKAIANQSSVGSRIRSNLNNIQRTSAAMDANFARK